MNVNRYDKQTEISLAVLPTLTMGIVLLVLERFSQQRLLFASLASSAFLIYVDPLHPANRIMTLVIAQVSAAIIGYLTVRIIGPGYLSAMIGMLLAIAVMVALERMHPPAVSTALTFAFTQDKTLWLFLIALGLLAVLLILRKVSAWLINRYNAANPQSNPAHASGT